MHGGGGEAPFLVVWKYLESLPWPEVPPKLGSLVFILSTCREGGELRGAEAERAQS